MAIPSTRDRRREQRRQSAVLDQMVRRYAPRIERSIAAAMRESINNWPQTHEVVLPASFRPAIEADYRVMIIAATEEFAIRILDQSKRLGLVLEVKEGFMDLMLRWALDYIMSEMIRRRITDVIETTRKQIVELIKAGYEQGKTQREIVDAILNAVPSLSKVRADRIARTETHGAANNGSQQAARSLKVPMRREWISAWDERTRRTHALADGQKVGMDEAFVVGATALMFPGDPNGPAGEVINCRCAVGYIVGSQMWD